MEAISQTGADKDFLPHHILAPGRVSDSWRTFGCVSSTKSGYPGQSSKKNGKKSGLFPTLGAMETADYQGVLD